MLRQTVAAEILVMDDASDTDLASLLAGLPVRYSRYDTPTGPCALRNDGVAAARSEFIFFFDDDSELVAADTLERTLADLAPADVGAVAIPYIDVGALGSAREDLPGGLQVPLTAPDPDIPYATDTFAGCAGAVRRSSFLKIGGFRDSLYYMNEEVDLCLRLLAAGFLTRIGTSHHILHHQSPLRSPQVALRLQRRNAVLFGWHNVPMPYLPIHALGAFARGVLASFRRGGSGPAVGAAWGLAAVARSLRDRDPVRGRIYRIHRRLRKRGPMQLDTVRRALRQDAAGAAGPGT